MGNSDAANFRLKVTGEVREEYDRMVVANVIIKTVDLVDSIVHRHMPAIYQMEDADEASFVVGAIHAATWNVAREFMNKVGFEIDKDKDTNNGQMRFVGGGFESAILQDRYAIRRDGEPVHSPLDRMSDLEIEAKAKEYEAMATANQRHADELRRYRRWRAGGASGAA